MNKNLKHQTAVLNAPATTEPSEEQIYKAVMMRRLLECPAFGALADAMRQTTQDLHDTAFNSARPQPVRINAIEQLSGIRTALDYPGSFCDAITQMLETKALEIDDYAEKYGRCAIKASGGDKAFKSQYSAENKQ